MRANNYIGLVALASIFTFSTCPTFGATISVPLDQPTVQAGINAAVEGDIVLVSPGVYVENLFYSGKDVTVQSEGGPFVTFVDGGDVTSVVIFSGGETSAAVLDGFTLTNGAGRVHHTELYGGGITCSFASPTIRNCRITGNHAEHCGGIDMYQSSPTITNCSITGNQAVLYGGGILCEASSPEITNCTIAGNSADRGGGIYIEDGSSPTITNSILWADTAPEGPEIWIGVFGNPSILTVSYSDVQGGEGDAHVEPSCTLSWDVGNISSAPLVVASGDFHLRSGSPCIDSGTDAGVYTDIEGDSRPQGAGFDMGVDEYIPGDPHLIAFIRHKLNENQYLNVHNPPSTVGGDINPLVASDTWIGNVGTNNEITHMTAGDIDGDGDEELIFIRHEVIENQYLNIYDEPEAVEGDINPLVASDKWIGKVGTDNEITHLAAGDIDGDGTDEVIFIRQRLNGNQYLNIHASPTTVAGEINPLIASDTWIGNIGASNEIMYMTAGDIEGDGDDELIFVRNRQNANQYLNIYDIPTTVGGETNPLVASDLWIGNIGTSTEVTHVAAGDTDGDGNDELVFIRHRENDNQYLNIYNPPTVVEGDINPLVASDIWIGNIGTNNEITHMTMIR